MADAPEVTSQMEPPQLTEAPPAPEAEKTHEETVPYERFQKANAKAKETSDQVRTLKAEMAQLREQLEMKANGATDAQQLEVRLQRAEARAQEMQEKAEAASAEATNTRRERWVSDAAAAHNFTDPADASVFLDLSEIEGPKDAERAIKRLASQKKYLVKQEERQLPGKVMEGGKAVQQDASRPQNGIDPMQDAQRIADGLLQFASPEVREQYLQNR